MMKAGAVQGGQHSVVTEFIIHMLGLDICADTIIGNAMKRGVSGGQKKRVTSGAHSSPLLHTWWRVKILKCLQLIHFLERVLSFISSSCLSQGCTCT